ncbi:MAG: glycosyltransferase family 39 protein [Synergistaceae bacterium]|jgi:4-amino-4-deoxy-L-arabinose transferase-like glycosyltransferase|nr:glycosyltransferase family 39 protein [Synergistaceae bacterium]
MSITTAINSENFRKNLCLKIFISALVFHLLAAAGIFYLSGKDVSTLHTPDTASYVATAAELVKYGTFSADGIPEIMRTPGYPLFLAIFIGLPKWELFVVAAQCFIAGLMAVVTYKLAESLGGARAGLFAAFFFTVAPLTARYNSYILTERLSSFLTALLCFAMFKFLRKPGMTAIILAAAAIAYGAFVRPIAMYLPYCVIAFLIFWGIAKKINVLRLVALLAVFSLISIAPIKLWEYRNFLASGYRGFSSNSAICLYFYNSARVLARLENKPFTPVVVMPERNGLSEGEMFNLMNEEAKGIIMDNLFVYAQIHLAGMLQTLLQPGMGSIRQEKEKSGDASTFQRIKNRIIETPLKFIIYVSLAISLAFGYILSLAAFVKYVKIHTFEIVFLALIAAYFTTLSGGTDAYNRFRQPFSFIIAIFAGTGINWLIAYIAEKRGQAV